MRTPATPGRLSAVPRSLVFALAATALVGSILAAAAGGGGRIQVGVQVLCYSLPVVSLLLIAIFRRQYLDEIGWMFLIAAHAFWFAIPALTQLLMPGHWFGDWIEMDVPNGALSKATILVSLFLCGNTIAYLGLRGRVGAPITPPRGLMIPSRQRLPLVLALFAAGLTPYILFGGGLTAVIQEILLGRAQKAWTADAADWDVGNAVMTLFWLSRAFLVTATTMSILYLATRQRRGRVAKAAYAGMVVLGLLIIFYDQGTRSYLVMAVAPVLTLIVMRRSFSGETFKPLRLMAIGAIGSIALLALTQIQVAYRAEYDRVEMGNRSVGDLMNPQHHADFFTETANAVVVRDEILREPLGESALLFFAINPIPRVLWKDKPLPMTMWHYTLYRWNIDIFEKGGNALPSVVGQYYINSSAWGVAWAGLLYGAVAAGLERLLRRSADRSEFFVMVGSALTFTFLSFRYLFPNFHYTTVTWILIVAFYAWRARVRKRRLRLARGPSLAGLEQAGVGR